MGEIWDISVEAADGWAMATTVFCLEYDMVEVPVEPDWEDGTVEATAEAAGSGINNQLQF